MAKKSERTIWIKKCKDLIRNQKYRLHGRRCQFCGSTKQLGLFHIFPVGRYPRIQLHEDNILIACWYGCHHKFHHDPYFARDIIFPKIKQLCGEDYEDYLNRLNETEPKLSLVRIKEIYEELREKDV